MRQIDMIHTNHPFLGTRKIMLELRDLGWRIGRRRCRRLMRIMGIEAMVPKPSLSKPAPGNKIYPYLLRELEVDRSDQVWCTDITYIPMTKGHAYLIAIMDYLLRRSGHWLRILFGTSCLPVAYPCGTLMGGVQHDGYGLLPASAASSSQGRRKSARDPEYGSE